MSAQHTPGAMRTPNATTDNKTVVVRLTLAEAMELLMAAEYYQRRSAPHGDNGPVTVCLDRAIGSQWPEYYKEMRGYSVEQAGQKCARLQPVDDRLSVAAPDMLATLKAAHEYMLEEVRFYKAPDDSDLAALANRCAAAIAKAEGKA